MMPRLRGGAGRAALHYCLCSLARLFSLDYSPAAAPTHVVCDVLKAWVSAPSSWQSHRTHTLMPCVRERRGLWGSRQHVCRLVLWRCNHSSDRRVGQRSSFVCGARNCLVRAAVHGSIFPSPPFCALLFCSPPFESSRFRLGSA